MPVLRTIIKDQSKSDIRLHLYDCDGGWSVENEDGEYVGGSANQALELCNQLYDYFTIWTTAEFAPLNVIVWLKDLKGDIFSGKRIGTNTYECYKEGEMPIGYYKPMLIPTS